MNKKKKKAINILKKVYHHTNTDYDKDYYGEIGYKTDFLTKEQDLLLKEFNLIPNDLKMFPNFSEYILHIGGIFLQIFVFFFMTTATIMALFLVYSAIYLVCEPLPTKVGSF